MLGCGDAHRRLRAPLAQELLAQVAFASFIQFWNIVVFYVVVIAVVGTRSRLMI